MRTQEGQWKIAAKRIGVSLASYRENLAGGLLWCCGCKAWHTAEMFSTGTGRRANKSTICKTCQKEKNRRYWAVHANVIKARWRRETRERRERNC